MAPEHAAQLIPIIEGTSQSLELDERADIFSLGAILFKLLTGQTLYSADRRVECLRLAADCRFDAGVLSPVPAKIRRVCLTSLAKNPEDRWQSAEEFTHALRDAVATPVSRRRVLFLAGSLAAAGLFVGYRSWKAARVSDVERDSLDNETDPTVPGRMLGPEEHLPGLRFTHVINSLGQGTLRTPLLKSKSVGSW